MCYGICTAESDDSTDDMEFIKRESFTDEDEDECENEVRRGIKHTGEDEEDENEEETKEKVD